MSYRALPQNVQQPGTPFQTVTPQPPCQHEKTWYNKIDGGRSDDLRDPESVYQSQVRQVTTINRWWSQPFQQIITRVAPGKMQVGEDARYGPPVAHPTPPVGDYIVSVLKAAPTRQSSLITNVIIERQADTQLVSVGAPKPKKQVR